MTGGHFRNLRFNWSKPWYAPMLALTPTGIIDMSAGDARLPPRVQPQDAAAAADRQAREARMDAERYAKRGKKEMYAVSLQAAKDLEASAAAHREGRGGPTLKPGKG